MTTREGHTPPTLREALDGLLMVCGRTGNALEDFEEQAAAFQKETGWMRVGKDIPMAHVVDERTDTEARRAKYHDWVESKIEAVRTALQGVEQ